MLYEPFLPLALSDPLEPEEPDELPEDDPPELLLRCSCRLNSARQHRTQSHLLHTLSEQT